MYSSLRLLARVLHGVGVVHDGLVARAVVVVVAAPGLVARELVLGALVLGDAVDGLLVQGVGLVEVVPGPVWKSTSASGARDNSSLSHFSAMTRPCWIGRAVRNRHHHAIEQASRRWRGGHDPAVAEAPRRENSIYAQVGLSSS